MISFVFIEDYRLKFIWIYNYVVIFNDIYISLSDSRILIRFSIVLAKLGRVLSSGKLWAEATDTK